MFDGRSIDGGSRIPPRKLIEHLFPGLEFAKTHSVSVMAGKLRT
jgi:hypothetical protein